MRMRNYLKEKLAEKPYVLGAFVASCNPTNVEILGMNGLDFVILDMEHSPLGLETMVDMIRAAEAYGMVAIPRVYTIETKLMRRVLDVGAHGLLVPMVNNMDDARYIMDAVKFPPLGARGMNAGRGPRWGGLRPLHSGGQRRALHHVPVRDPGGPQPRGGDGRHGRPGHVQSAVPAAD